MELTEGAVVADRFRLMRLLGQGGMGEVWAAQHTSLDIPCAVKFIHAESAENPEVRARFEREAKAAAQLRTPNVVQILDYGIFENTPYIAMEYLAGEPLNERLKQRGRLDPHETFRIITGVAKALTKAHNAGIVHRDLKPENIFLVRDEDQEIPKVLDFGVAKSTTTLDSNTATGALLGTPYYMSPEQAQGTKAVDHRADLWSLAVVVFRCLTGELPFKSTALGDLLIKIVTHPLPVPSHLEPNLPRGFDVWWERAAQRDPDQRFQSAKELVESLGLALSVSMPSQLGLTPMPGTMGARTVAFQPDATAIHDPSTDNSQPMPFGSAPSAAGAVGATTEMPSYQSGGYPPAYQSGGYPSAAASGAHGSGMYPSPGYQPAQHAAAQAQQAQQAQAQQALSNSSALSIGGVQAPLPPKKNSKAPVIGALAAALLVAGGVATFLATRSSGDESPAEETAPVAADQPTETGDGAPETAAPAAESEETTAETTDVEAPDDAETAPEASAEASAAKPVAAKPPTKPAPRPAGKPAPKTAPKPTKVKTDLDVPAPKPAPKPKTDFGF